MPKRSGQELNLLHQRLNDLVDRLRDLWEREREEVDPKAREVIAVDIKIELARLRLLKMDATGNPNAADVLELINLLEERIRLSTPGQHSGA